MLKRRKLRSLLIGLALLALVGLLSSTTGQEAAWAESAQAQVTVTLEISNTSMPLGGTTYEIQMITFTKNFIPIATQIIIPYASIPPQETRTFGPFTLSETPNDLTLRGRKTFPYQPFEEPFSFTIFPLYSDMPYQVDRLVVTAQIVTIAPPPPEHELPRELVNSIELGQCPCPHPTYCPQEATYPYYLPWGSDTYRLEWWEDHQGPEAFARKHTLAWYNEDSRWAFYLKEVGFSGDQPTNRGHDGHGAVTFRLPAPSWGPNNDLALANYDAQYGGVYYTNPAFNRSGVQQAKVFELVNWLPGGWVICWEDWWGGGDQDFNDEIDVLTYPVAP